MIPRSSGGAAIFWLLVIAAYFAFPSRHLLINDMAITGIFALSLDLILGYAGILSLGHAAFLGLGAYIAGIITMHGVRDPLLGLLITAACCALAGLLSSLLVLRGADLTRLMVTLGVSLVLYEIANRLPHLTGGADGLQGVDPGPLPGGFEFDLTGHVAAAYSLISLFVIFLFAKILLASPFGWSLRAIRQNRLRAAAIGIPVNLRLIAIYTISGTLAGIAGALLAQTTQFVSLDELSFRRSADVLLITIIGGTGWLYGGLIGTIIFKLMQDQLANITPQYWQFWIGLLLVLIVLIGRDRIAAWPRLLTAHRLFTRRP